jgi:hypothetical protein
MSDVPEDQPAPQETEPQADHDIAPVVGPPPAAIPEQQPVQPEQPHTAWKHRWTHDPAMFWITFAGVVAVVAYTSVAAWQAYLTRNQLNVLQGQLDEMRRDQRAWLAVGNVSADPKVPEVGKVWQLNFFTANSGKTPAINVQAVLNSEGVDRDKLPNFDYRNSPIVHLGYIAPGSVAPSHSLLPLDINTRKPVPVIQQTLDRLVSGDTTIYLHGRIDYRDIFRNPHWVTYCYFLKVPLVGSFGACPFHNDTDETKGQ